MVENLKIKNWAEGELLLETRNLSFPNQALCTSCILCSESSFLIFLVYFHFSFDTSSLGTSLWKLISKPWVLCILDQSPNLCFNSTLCFMTFFTSMSYLHYSLMGDINITIRHKGSVEGANRQNRLHIESRTPSWARQWNLSYMSSIYRKDIPTGKPDPWMEEPQGSYLDSPSP